MTDPARPQLFEFVLMDMFSMMAVSSAIEPMRAANRLLKQDAYRWRLVSEDGEAVTASNAISVNVEGRFGDGEIPDYCFVVAGLSLVAANPVRLSALLNKRAQQGVKMGALSMGPIFLARAGLLSGVSCTMHWEGQPAFKEEFPDVLMSNQLYAIDGNRFTCAGGVAAVDLFLTLIGQDHGETLAREVGNQFQIDRIRSGMLSQRSGSAVQLENAPKQLVAAVDIMARNIETPIDTLALAERVGLSRRTMERLFTKFTGTTPSKYYKILRLEHARELLLHANMSNLDIAIATGFQSSSYFSACFIEHFGHSPSSVRANRELV